MFRTINLASPLHDIEDSAVLITFICCHLDLDSYTKAWILSQCQPGPTVADHLTVIFRV